MSRLDIVVSSSKTYVRSDVHFLKAADGLKQDSNLRSADYKSVLVTCASLL